MSRIGVLRHLLVTVALLVGVSSALAQPEPEVRVASQISHAFPVQQVLFATNGRYGASRDTRGINIWELSTGRLINSIETFLDDFDISPDGKRLLLVRSSSGVRILDAVTGGQLHYFGEESTNVTAARFFPTEDKVLLVKWDEVTLWEPSAQNPFRTVASHGCLRIAFSSTGNFVACGLSQNVIELWDGRSLKPLSSFKSEVSGASFKWIGFSSDDKNISAGVCNYQKCVLESWDIATGANKFLTEVQKTLVTAAYSSNGTQLVAVATEHFEKSLDGTDRVRLKGGTHFIDANSGTLVVSHLFDEEIFGGDHENVTISGDGARILAGDWNGRITVIDTRTGSSTMRLGQAISPIKAIAYSQAINQLVSGDEAGNIRAWNLATGAQLWTRPPVKSHGTRKDEIKSLAYSNDGTRIVSLSEYHSSINVWNAGDGSLVHELKCTICKTSPDITVFSHDGRWLVTAGSWRGEGRALLLWDLVTGSVRHDFDGYVTAVSSVAFSKDDTTVITDDKSGQIIWATATGQKVMSLGRLRSTQIANGKECHQGELSSDGARLLCPMPLGDANDGPYVETLWDTKERTFLGRIGDPWNIGDPNLGPLFATIDRVTFSTDSTHIGILRGGAYQKMDVGIWNAYTGMQSAGFSGFGGKINSVAFDANGSRLITGGDDGTIRIWTRDGTQLIQLIGSGESYIAITPAGFFMSSDPNSNLLTVIRGTHTYAISQFRDQLFREDLVRDQLSGDTLGRYRDAASQVSLGNILKSGSVPNIEFVSQSAWAGDTIQLTVRLSNNEVGGIGKDLEWRVTNSDGKNKLQGTSTPPELQRLQDSGGPVHVTHSLKLDPEQDNIITVTAKNEGGLATEPYKIVVKKRLGVVTEDGIKPQPRMFIIAIGVDGYTEPQLAKLTYPVIDVVSVAKALKAVAEISGYKEGRIIPRLEKDAVREKIKDAFDEIASFGYQRIDTLVILLAGHGKSVDGQYYYLPYDAKFGDGRNIFTEGISTDAWKEWIAEIKVNKKLIIVDTCESSSAIAIGRGNEELVHATALDRLRVTLGESIVTAARQVAYEGSFLGHGVLTYSVLEAFGTPRPDSSMMDLNSLKVYLEDAVPRWSQKLSGLPQNPTIKISDNFPIGYPLAQLQPSPSHAAAPFIGEYVLTHDVQVHTSANSDSFVTETLRKYTKVGVLEHDGAWIKISRQGVPRGWVPRHTVQELK